MSTNPEHIVIQEVLRALDSGITALENCPDETRWGNTMYREGYRAALRMITAALVLGSEKAIGINMGRIDDLIKNLDHGDA